MINPALHDKLMQTDIDYATKYLQAIHDQDRAVMYESLKQLAGEKWSEKEDEIRGTVLDMMVCGGPFPVKKQYRI